MHPYELALEKAQNDLNACGGWGLLKDDPNHPAAKNYHAARELHSIWARGLCVQHVAGAV